MSDNHVDGFCVFHRRGRAVFFAVCLIASGFGIVGATVTQAIDGVSAWQMIRAIFSFLLGFMGVQLAIRAIGGAPFLEISRAGIRIGQPFGPMFLNWDDVESATPGVFQSVKLTLRPGARPHCSVLVRITSASWSRRSVAFSTLTTDYNAEELITKFNQMRDVSGAA